MDVLDMPALAPPPGVTPNFDSPKDLSNPNVAVLQLTVTTLVVGLRLYTKGIVLRRMMVEDYFLLAAWVAFLGFNVLVFMMEALPLGVHQWDLKVGKAMKHAKLFQIAAALYALVAAPLKIAIILQIRRVFVSSQYNSRSRFLLQWTMNLFLVLNALFYASLFLFQLLMCKPLNAVWDPRVPGRCARDHWVIHIVSASVNTASDLITVALPQPFIWRLKMKRRRKLGLSAVFALGATACAASTARLYYSIQLYTSADHTYQAAKMGKWADPELTLGFSAATLPILPAFFKHLTRTALGRGVRSLRTQSPLSESEAGKKKNSAGYAAAAAAGGSSGITKVVEMDIEFAQLTRLESGNGGAEGEGGCGEEAW